MSSRFLLIAARLAAETDRADAAERQVAELFAQIRVLHKDKLQLRAELAKSHQELQLWKVQLDLAQKGAIRPYLSLVDVLNEKNQEILRAQTVVDQIDRARADAEDQAHRFRRQVRQLVEERSIQTAIDEGRRIGFQEGLELGRKRQVEHRTTTPRPPSRRDSARTPAPPPVPPVPVPQPASVPVAQPAPVPATQPAPVPTTQPAPVPTTQPAPVPVTQPTVTQPASEELRQPIPLHNVPESVHDTYEVPPDNFIPVIHQGEPGIMLPPPHEWINRPRSESQSTHPPPNEPRPVLLSPIPETKTPNHHSRSSSRISQFDILGPPTTETQRTQPERIADEWRAQNPDVVTPTPTSISTKMRIVPQSDVVAIPRPKSTTNHLGAKFIPPQRPTTTEPTSIRSNTGSKSSRKQSRQPITVSNIFYDRPTSTTPKPITADQDWLKSQFSLPKRQQRQHEKGSPTNTERTAVNPALLPTHELEHRSAKDTSPPKIKRAPSVAPTTLSTATSTTNTMMAYNMIPGPPMFTLPPLSPIPTLSNLSSIPETRSVMMGTSAGTASDGDQGDGDSGFGYERQQQQQQQQQYQRPPSRMTKPSSSAASLSMSVKEKDNPTTSVLGPSTNYFSDYYQNYPIHQQQQFYQAGPTDTVVMNSRVESPPAGIMNANVNAYGGDASVSPAPLNRRLSIFDDM